MGWGNTGVQFWCDTAPQVQPSTGSPLMRPSLGPSTVPEGRDPVCMWGNHWVMVGGEMWCLLWVLGAILGSLV